MELWQRESISLLPCHELQAPIPPSPQDMPDVLLASFLAAATRDYVGKGSAMASCGASGRKQWLRLSMA